MRLHKRRKLRVRLPVRLVESVVEFYRKKTQTLSLPRSANFRVLRPELNSPIAMLQMLT